MTRTEGEVMSLAERLKAAHVQRKPKWTDWVERLDDDDREALIESARSQMSTKSLIAAIRAEGGSIGEEPLKEWRRSHGWVG